MRNISMEKKKRSFLMPGEYFMTSYFIFIAPLQDSIFYTWQVNKLRFREIKQLVKRPMTTLMKLQPFYIF